MSHYEERLTQDRERISVEIVEMAADVRLSFDNSISALLTGDKDLAYNTIIHDQIVNRRVEALDRSCHAFVARHLPSAGHLRFISSALRMNMAIERIGDYAVTICREAVRLTDPVPEVIQKDLRSFAVRASDFLAQAIEAFRHYSAELAKDAKFSGGKISSTYDHATEDLVQEGESGTETLPDLFSYLVVFGRIGRVCDQAKNICEEVIFSVTGEVKPGKIFRILFLDESNTCAGFMAAACAREMFGERAAVTSTGLKPDSRSTIEMTEFLKDHGYSMENLRPGTIELSPEQLQKFHIIVCLKKDLSKKLGPIPYRVVVLNWSIHSCQELLKAGKDTAEVLGTVHDEIKEEMENLKKILVGENGIRDAD